MSLLVILVPPGAPCSVYIGGQKGGIFLFLLCIFIAVEKAARTKGGMRQKKKGMRGKLGDPKLTKLMKCKGG